MNIDFSLVLFILLLLTGGITLLDRFVLAPKRNKESPESWWIEYAKSFLPVIFIVFFIRSFLVEPFKIPSGSMIPTLQVGDFILVNKFNYGIRLPVINQKIISLNNPQRGDVMVFRYPENPSINYIKRVIAVSGDAVEYKDKQLYINGELQEKTLIGDYNYTKTSFNFVHAEEYQTKLADTQYHILNEPERPTLSLAGVVNFPGSEYCEYDYDRVKCKVPENSYFMLGDNRDDSRDSRYWGFVPDSYVVGKAFLIWFNWSDWGRVGQSIN